jgi:hypothetical protein
MQCHGPRVHPPCFYATLIHLLLNGIVSLFRTVRGYRFFDFTLSLFLHFIFNISLHFAIHAFFLPAFKLTSVISFYYTIRSLQTVFVNFLPALTIPLAIPYVINLYKLQWFSCISSLLAIHLEIPNALMILTKYHQCNVAVLLKLIATINTRYPSSM